VANAQGYSNIAGFVSAYIPPTKKGTLFVWQVAVNQDYRKNGIAAKMITSILSRSSCKDVSFLEATVTPSNDSSKNLFASVASHFNARLDISPFFAEDRFENSHEAEELVRVGPLQKPEIVEASLH
jgi:L-2,4-diaminobutyric acid acetyltransferase